MAPEPLLATEAKPTPEGQTDITPSGDSSSAEGKEQSQTQVGSTETPEAEKPKGAPEAYTFSNPEGMPEEIEGDSEIHDAYAKAARELNLPQAQAQTLYDTTMTAIQKRAMGALEARTQEWVKAAKSDPEYGGDKFDENMEKVFKAREMFGSESLRELLKDPTGVGNHPEFIRFFFRVGEAVSEDRFVGSDQGQTVDLKDPAVQAAKLFPSSVKN